LERKKNEKGESWKKNEKIQKKSKKKKGMHCTVDYNRLIHNAFGCGETMISPHHLVVCIIS
jgi:hypothetical protein